MQKPVLNSSTWKSRRTHVAAFTLLGIASLLTASRTFAAPSRVNTTGWRVDGPGQISSRRDGFVRIDYDSPEHEPVLFLPSQPIELQPNAARIGLWFAIPRGDANIAFLIEDGSGTLHETEAARNSRLHGWAIDWEGARRSEWPLWSRCESMFLRAPAQQTIRNRMPRDRWGEVTERIWPAPLRLAGIKIIPLQPGDRWGGAYWRPDREAMEEGTGRIWLTDLNVHTQTSFEANTYSFLKERLRWNRNDAMVLFADDLVTGTGKTPYRDQMRYGIQVRRGYQGPVVWRRESQTVLDAADPVALYRNRISLPALAPGRYFIRTKVWTPRGTLIRQRRFQWFIGEGPEAKRDTVDIPFDLSTGQTDNVFPANTTAASLQLRIDPKRWQDIPGKVSCRLHIIDWLGNTVLEESISSPGNRRLTVPVKAGTDYFATAELKTGGRIYGRVYDRSRLHFGVASPPPALASDLPENVQDLDQLLEDRSEPHAEYRVARAYRRTFPYLDNIDLDDFRVWCGQARDVGSEIVSIKCHWPQVELLPGVFRWEIVDRQVDIMREHGQKVIFGYTPIRGWPAPIWLNWSPVRDQYGNFPFKMRTPSHWGSPYHERKVAFWKRMAQHFYGNSGVAGYRVHAHPFVADTRPDPIRTDYAKPARKAFGDWLRENGKPPHPLPELFAVPGTDVSDLPPDLSDTWRQFVLFNSHTIHATVADILDAIRSVDSTRPVLVDRKSMPYAIEGITPLLAQDANATLKNEGSPRFVEDVLRSMTMQAGVPHLSELHRHQPTSRSIADATNFWSSYLADRVLWLLRWSPEELVNPRGVWEDVPEVLQFVARTRAAWDEFIKPDFVQPRVLVVGSRMAELVGGQRRGFFNQMAGANLFEALFRVHQVQTHYANAFSDWVDLNDFELVFATGDVLPLSTVERLERYARNGGKTVLVGDVGRYTIERPDESDLLRDRIGDLQNVVQIGDLQQLDVPGVRAWAAPYALEPATVERLLNWADITRPIEATAEDDPGFECQLRITENGNRAYVAVMRTYYGWYRGNIEKEEVLREKWGTTTGRVTVRGLADGSWRVQKMHRDTKDMGMRDCREGVLRFDLDPAVAGEVEMFRLTRQ